MFITNTDVIRQPHRPPHVKTHNGGCVSVGGPFEGTILDVNEEAAAWAASLELSDATAVGFVLSLARWCDLANRRDPQSYAVVTVEEYCQARGWQKHHKGGYKTEHKEQARREMFVCHRSRSSTHRMGRDISIGAPITRKGSRYCKRSMR